MQVIKVIQLNDGSIHETKERAQNHLFRKLSSGECLKLFEKMAHQNAHKLKGHFIDNQKEVSEVLKIVKELNDLENLKF